MRWTLPSNEQLRLYRSLFNVREDVFAIRWEKGKKKGYYPAYQFDPYRYRLHKIKGGSLKDFPDKSPLKLDDSQLMKHFSGDQFIGGYPLLHDNSSWFIAADFDGEKWKTESLKFIKVCQEQYISPYLERSQSGNGAHVWVFFDESYPAFKSRSVITFLLEKAEIISKFDKSSSFDRLFPNQDQLSGKKLGNLIALPFQGKSLLADNSCFIDPNTLTAIEDQWDFISKIKRTEVQILDKIYDEIGNTSRKVHKINDTEKIIIRLDNYLHLSKILLTSEIRDFLKEELNIANSE
ncbi:MAG: restriction endonuclease subunit R, partial [Bacteroidota bacterium]